MKVLLSKDAVRCVRFVLAVVATFMLLPASPHGQVALGNAISYQGRLSDGGAPASGSYDLRFTLFDAVSGGAQVGSVVTAAATTVMAGVFTVSLDFGAGAFAGSARWLEVGVRPGGTSGAFTILAPRQALLAGPQALYAVSAETAASAVTATSATTAASAANATFAIFANTAFFADQLAGQTGPYYLDFANHTGTLGVGQGGTGATSIAASPFLTKFVGSCEAGSSLQAINPDGTVLCQVTAPPPRAATVVTTIDSPGSVGLYTSITIGTDGFGLISYFDTANQHLKVAHCANAACTSATSVTIDGSTNVGLYTSITIGADGLGLISYWDLNNQDLKVAHCANTACTSAALATLDSLGQVGSYTSITIGVDNLGLISYQDAANSLLKVAHCQNAACSNASVATLDGGGPAFVGSHTSITLGPDGRGLISYFDESNGDLKVAHCADVPCTHGTQATLDSAGVVGSGTSIVIGADGRGLISYSDITNGDLKVAHCADATCSSATRATLDGIDAVGERTSITIGADDLGLISYADNTNGDLKVAHCENTACTAASLVTIDSTGTVGQFPSITFGVDGLGLISYFDGSNSDLKVAHCGITSCTPFVVRRR